MMNIYVCVRLCICIMTMSILLIWACLCNDYTYFLTTWTTSSSWRVCSFPTFCGWCLTEDPQTKPLKQQEDEICVTKTNQSDTAFIELALDLFVIYMIFNIKTLIIYQIESLLTLYWYFYIRQNEKKKYLAILSL